MKMMISNSCYARLIEGSGTEILRKIRSKVEISEDEKRMMLDEIYAKRSERRGFC
ncbi:hypothetical protein Asulf_01831 [Archaeoglobus sulfaticallidus PM70-1]|uniref:Uncharacterized protein n=1 Tax=Archaeoglobus sulfaticallidus PM70-1 TaxID=387631 RepID=N0BME4_9EURY|nr:hypothetical protein [Archaeoglobus sulfaticallidus]AGK61801.1 hypothetical protein Asulf_01831 [Archaeoglobus sulfaticallidus PM70-1]